MIDESAYQKLADRAFRQIEDMLKDVDADDVDVERAGDVITMTFRGGRRAVVNTQRPTRQIWLAANARAWHFDYDEGRARWVDSKAPDVELFRQVAAIVKDGAGLEVDVP